MIDLTGKKVLITGASSGIGHSTAVLAASLGAKVVLMARRQDLLKKTVEKLAGTGHQFYVIDISDDDKVIKAVTDSVLNDHVPFDGFVHSAGMEMTIPLKVLKREAFEKAIAVNTFSAFEISKILLQKGNFNKAGGSFIFIASVMADLGQPAKIGYCATKGALVAGARAMALELASKRIRVNSILPGMVQSEMSRDVLNSLDNESVAKIIGMHPLGLGQVEDVANCILFLLSDASRWITGTSLFVDGGYSAM